MVAVRIFVAPEGICWQCNSTGWIGMDPHAMVSANSYEACRACDSKYIGEEWPENAAFEVVWNRGSTTVYGTHWLVDGPE